MDEKLYRKIRVLNTWFLIVLMLALFFSYYIPWFSIDQDHPVEDNLYFNINMIKKSTDEEIQDISEKAELLIISMWIILIFSLFSQLGLSIYNSPEYNTIGLLFILSGSLITVISSFLAFIFNYMVINGIQGLSAPVYPSYVMPGINYYYLPLASIMTLMVLSVYYTLLVAPSCLNHLKKIEIEEDKEIWRKASESQNQRKFVNPPDTEEITKTRKDIKLPAGFEGNNLKDQTEPKKDFFNKEENGFKSSGFSKNSKSLDNTDFYKKTVENKVSQDKNIPFFDDGKKEKDTDHTEKNEFRSPAINKETQASGKEEKEIRNDDYKDEQKSNGDKEYIKSESKDEDKEFKIQEEKIETPDVEDEKLETRKQRPDIQQNQVSVWGKSNSSEKNNEETKEEHDQPSADMENLDNKSDSFEKSFLSKFEKRLGERKNEKESSDFTVEKKEEKISKDKESASEKTTFSKEKAKSEIMKFLQENRENYKNEQTENARSTTNEVEKSVFNSKELEPSEGKPDIGLQSEENAEKVTETIEEKKPVSEEKESIETSESEQVEENESIDVFNVRCPKCQNEFEVENNSDDVIHTKCPHCGETGIIRKN